LNIDPSLPCCPILESRPMRDIPKETIERWIARDEAEMAEFASAGKRKRK